MSDIQTSTIRVPKNVLEDIKIYCRKAGQPVVYNNRKVYQIIIEK